MLQMFNILLCNTLAQMHACKNFFSPMCVKSDTPWFVIIYQFPCVIISDVKIPSRQQAVACQHVGICVCPHNVQLCLCVFFW